MLAMTSKLLQQHVVTEERRQTAEFHLANVVRCHQKSITAAHIHTLKSFLRNMFVTIVWLPSFGR